MYLCVAADCDGMSRVHKYTQFNTKGHLSFTHFDLLDFHMNFAACILKSHVVENVIICIPQSCLCKHHFTQQKKIYVIHTTEEKSM